MKFDLSKLELEHHAVAAFSALLILAIGWSIAGWAGRGVRKLSQRSGRISPTLVPLFASIARLSIGLMVLLAALEKVGVQTSGLFAAIGAAGLALGLALKDTVADVAAGIVLLVLRPFDVGEAVDIGGSAGEVTAIDLFQTKLVSFDGVPLVLNNSAVRNAVIKNFSRATTRRVDIEVGIDYGSDVSRALTAVRAVLAADPRVLPQPAAAVNTTKLTDSAVVLLARFTTKAADAWDTQLDLTRAIKERLDREGVRMPAPPRELRVVTVDDRDATPSEAPHSDSESPRATRLQSTASEGPHTS